MLSNYNCFCLFVFNIKTNMKIIVKTKITVGAGALSIQKLEYIPINIAINETNTEIIIIFLNLLFIKKAIAPGAIIKEIERINPSAFKVATMVSDIEASKLNCKIFTLKPDTIACISSKEHNSKSRHFKIKNKVTKHDIINDIVKSFTLTPSIFPNNI